MNGIHYVKCMISAGGFSGERTFSVELANGHSWEGTASVRYFRNADGQPFREHEPEPGTSLGGFVECRVLRQEGGNLVVEFPSSDLAYLHEDAVAETLEV